MERPIRLLVSAFACEPGGGSEQEVGWRWALELSGVANVTVLTQLRNRPRITAALANGAGEGKSLHFEYFQLPEQIYRMKSAFDFLTLPYYALWQWFAMRHVRQMHKHTEFDLIHHLTFATFRVPIWMKHVGPPVVLGPVGGAEIAPWKLLAYRASARAWTREAFRNLMTQASVTLMKCVPPIFKENGICLAATPGMLSIFQIQGLPSKLFPTIGAEGNSRAPIDRTTNEGGCRFLYVGRLHILKGIQFLLQSFADSDLEDATLTIVGWGPEESRLKSQADELGLGNRICWKGRVPWEAVAEIYANHDVLLAPSMYESGGISVLEAMEQGLPAIVLDAGGHAVSVTDDCGIKVDAHGSPRDVISDISEAMKRYATDPELRRIHGENARNRVISEYEWPKKVRRMQQVYSHLLGRK